MRVSGHDVSCISGGCGHRTIILCIIIPADQRISGGIKTLIYNNTSVCEVSFVSLHTESHVVFVYIINTSGFCIM